MIGAVNLYTQQLLYVPLNRALRDEDRTALKLFFPFLQLLLTALNLLPSMQGLVYRGVSKVRVKVRVRVRVRVRLRAPPCSTCSRHSTCCPVCRAWGCLRLGLV